VQINSHFPRISPTNPRQPSSLVAFVRDEEAIQPHAKRVGHGQAIGRPKALDKSKAALAQRRHVSGESATTIVATLGGSRATIYRVLAEQNDDGN
jgi:helix-turn-helix resolvase-like protein